MAPTVDFIVPCLHNKQSHFINTQRCVKAIKQHTPHELWGKLIIVENLETWMVDEAQVYASFDYPRNCAENVNTGLYLSTADYLCVVTNDVFVPEGYLQAMLECFTLHNCGVATLDSTQFGRFPSNEIIEMFFGGIWMVSRESFNDIGYWDTQFQHSFDDADYWVRAYKAGYKVYMNRSIVVEHNQGGQTIYDLNGSNHNSIYDRNRELFNKKHEGCNLPIFHKLK